MVLPGEILIEVNHQEFDRLGFSFLMDPFQFETVQVDVRAYFFWVAKEDKFCFPRVDREVPGLEPFCIFVFKKNS